MREMSSSRSGSGRGGLKGRGKVKKGGRRLGGPMRKRFCRFCADKIKHIDYKDVKKLESFVTERGKILSSRVSGNCAKHQRRVCDAIKMARYISLIPYIK